MALPDDALHNGDDAAAAGRSGAAAEDDFGFQDETWMARLGAALGAGASGGGDASPGVIGEYELIERIGAGAQGVVYKARQPRTGRLVAIKRVALADGHDERARARFLREVELAASLRGSGIVTIHEVLADASAVVMEWIDGEPADAWSDRQRREAGGGPIRRIAGVARAACEAVAFAHGRGVIHRDLKPGNILVDGENRPHVVDFGLAREAGAADATLTIAGSFAGTPAYAPPEQLDRGLHEVDVRADVYAMGAVLYRMLTGRDAFEAPTLAGLFDAVRRGHPPASSSIEPRVDRELDAIVLMALRPRAEERYQTMAELAEDLRRWLERRAVRAHGPSGIYLARAFVRRHRMGVALSVAALLLIVGFAAAAGVTAVQLGAQRDRLATTLGERDEALERAQASEARAMLELYKSRAGVEALFGVLEDLDGSRSEIARSLEQRRAEARASPVPVRPEIQLGIDLTIAHAFAAAGHDALALATAEEAVAAARQAGVGGSDLAEALAMVGEAAMRTGDYDQAVDAIRASLDAVSGEPQPDEAMRGHLLLLEALGAAGRRDAAQQFARTIPPMPGPAGPFMARRVRELCEQFALTPPTWAAP